MPSPFPGMDPYLETPFLWPDVHHELISQIRRALNPQLRPRFTARVESRVYISDPDDPGREAIIPDIRIEKSPRRSAPKPRSRSTLLIAEPVMMEALLDEEIHESRLEIRDPKSDALITVIEVMSPTNKILGARGRDSYMKKRRETLDAQVNWVEIDLLRAGVPSVPRPSLKVCDYRVMVIPAGTRKRGHYWPIRLREPLPVVGIPLRVPEPEVALDLAAVLIAAYEIGGYDLSINYARPPEPPLNSEDARWSEELIRGKARRKRKSKRSPGNGESFQS